MISRNFKGIGIPSDVCPWEIILRVKLRELLTIENGGRKDVHFRYYAVFELGYG